MIKESLLFSLRMAMIILILLRKMEEGRGAKGIYEV